MAINKKMLQKFLDNPAMFSAHDMGLEDGESIAPDESSPEKLDVQPESIDDALKQKVESPDQEYNKDEEIPTGVEQPNQSTDKMVAELPNKQYQGDPEIMAMIQKLKAGKSLEDNSEQDNQDVASDMEAPMDLRKKAMQKIKQKYLGQ